MSDERFLRRGRPTAPVHPDAAEFEAEFAARQAPPWDLSSDDLSSDDRSQDADPTEGVLREIRSRRRPRAAPASKPPSRRSASEAGMPSRTAREAARAQVLPFRRSTAERRVRRLRRHPLVRWLQPLSIALVLVGIPLASSLWMLRAPAFAVDEIRMSSDSPSRRVSEQWVRDRLGGVRGQNLWLLDLEMPVTEMRKHPWVRDIGIRKQPPSTLVVRVLEKQEAALYRDPAGLVYVDTDGSPVAPLGPNETDVGLTVLSGKVAEPAPGKPAPELRAAVALLQEIQTAGPAWATGLDRVEILSTRDFRVHTTDLPFPILVRAGTVDERSRRLEQLLPWISELGRLRAVDLRFVRRIIVEPAAPDTGRGHLEAT